MSVQNEIKIGDRRVGPDHPLYIIAECGVTCNYDLDITKKLIDVVAESGADAIKLIFWFPDEIMAERSTTWTYETVDGTKSEDMYEMLSELQFTLDEWHEVKQYADEQGVFLFGTTNSPSGIEYAEELDLEAYKMSSWEYNHHPLWRQVARQNKPVLMDTGPVDKEDVSKVMKILHEEDNHETVLVHCYHTDNPESMNMNSIPYLRKAFNSLVGYSAPDYRDDNDLLAVALGAVVLEKRLTLDRSLPGHHHVLSKEPQEFSDYVDKVRRARRALGTEDLTPSQADQEAREEWFRHLVADCAIQAGSTITEDMLAGKRYEDRDPAECISPEFIDIVTGRELKHDLTENQAITWDDI